MQLNNRERQAGDGTASAIEIVHGPVIVGVGSQADPGTTLVEMLGILDRLRPEEAVSSAVLGAIQLRPLLGDTDAINQIRQI